jgi:predicted  nucleic acid-binding Zn-ribbon protein
MLKSVATLQSLSNNLQSATTQNVTAQEAVAQAMDEVQSFSREILEASNEQQIGGREIVGAMHQLKEVVETTRQSITDLNDRVSAFKV